MSKGPGGRWMLLKWAVFIGLILFVAGYTLADEGHEHAKEVLEEHVAEGESQEHVGAQVEEEHEHAEGEEEPHEHVDAQAEGEHEHAEGEGHAGHDHAKPSFEEYGLVKAEKGYKEFNIRLERFKYYPEVIKVNKGDRVKLNLDSIDVEHGFYLDGYGIDVIVPEKGFTSVEFTASKPGAFRFRCSSTCGAFHPFMVGKFVAGPNYTFWGSLAGVVFFPVGALVYFTSKKRGDEKWKD